MFSWSRETYIRAYRFAAEAHYGQKIPGTDRPYIVHSAMVAMEIITVLSNEPGWNGNLAIQCALLHDVLEDTGISYEQIESHFGRDVADGVQALSHDIDIKDRNQRVIDAVRRIRTQPWKVWMVKLADRIVNLLPPPPHWTGEKISEYRNEAKFILRNLGKANPFLSRRLSRRIANYPPGRLPDMQE